MIDIEFIKYIYQPIINNKKIINNKEIINYVENNRDIIVYISKDDFFNKINFDYIFYSNYYEINKSSELACIYHYINYGIYLNYSTNKDDIIKVTLDLDENLSIENIIDKKN